MVRNLLTLISLKLSYVRLHCVVSYIFHGTNIKVHIYENQILYPTPAEVPNIITQNNGIIADQV